MAAAHLMEVVGWEIDSCQFDEAEISVLKCTVIKIFHKATSTEEGSSTVRLSMNVRKCFKTKLITLTYWLP